MAGGPGGHVAVGAGSNSVNGCNAGIVVLTASGAVAGGGCGAGAGGSESCGASASPAFDPHDGLLCSYSVMAGRFAEMDTTGYGGEAVNASFSWANGSFGATTVYPGIAGADNAGDLYVGATVQGVSEVNFGLGYVGQGTYLLHYNPSGALVSDTLPTGIGAVGALGHLYYAPQVTGTVDEGCGTVGTAGVTSTVLTQRNATGVCFWSKALPPSIVLGLDPSENVLLATTFSGTIDFGGGPLTSVGTSDLAIAKLTPSGAVVWSKSFGASGASVSGISALGATSTGGLALSVGLSGAVDFGCGAVTSSTGATTLFANFDATGTVVYSRVVQLLAGSGHLGPVVDGLGGITYAVQVTLPPQSCACTTSAQCPQTFGDFCNNGMCESCPYNFPTGGDILVSRFAL